MDAAEAKQELNNYRRIYNEVENKKKRLAELERELYGLKLFKSDKRVKSSPSPISG